MPVVTATTNTNVPTTRQLSDGNGANGGGGNIFGTSASDTISFWGATPISQPTHPAQAALTVTGSAAVTQYASTQSPSSVATITVAEQSITVTGVLAADFVIVNKPTSQAGLGLCAPRVSAANTVKLVFANVTAGTLTPTGSEAYLVTTVQANLQLSATLTPLAVAANTVVEQTFTGVTGIYPGMLVSVNKPTTQAGLGVLSARASANNTLSITYINATAATITPTAAEVYLIAALNGIPGVSQTIKFGANVGTLSGVATITTSEQAVTVAGINADDVMIGMTKPTTQAGLGLVSGRVSAANTIQVTFVNPTAGTLTPTASEVYGVTVFRPSPGAILTLYTTATLTPGSVAANTSAEQTFTVTGLVSGQPVAVSPLYNVSATPGVGIAGVRASATNTLAVTFINTTAAAITPPAGPWTVGTFNQTTPTAGNSVTQLAIPIELNAVAQVSVMRSAFVAAGLIKGS